MFASDHYGTVYGNVLLEDGTGSIEDAVISGDLFRTQPDIDGNYVLQLIPGIYDLRAALTDYLPETIQNVEVETGDNIGGQDFVLSMFTGSSDDNVLHSFWVGDNYPNPFNPITSIDFNLTDDNSPVNITVYNIKGQHVNSLVNETLIITSEPYLN